MSNIAQLPESIPYSHGGALDSPAFGSSLPRHSAQSRGFGVPAGPFDAANPSGPGSPFDPANPSGPGSPFGPGNPSGPGSPSDPAVVNIHLVLSPANGGPANGGPAPSGTIQGDLNTDDLNFSLNFICVC